MGVGISRCRKPATPSRRQEDRTVADVVMEIANSASIEKALRRDRANLENTINILLLGGADAGKSTILKQMRILHMNGFSDDEMYSFHKYLRRNLYQIFHEIAVELRENSDAIADSEKKIINQFSEDNTWFVGMEEHQEVEWLIDFRKLNCVQSYLDHFPNYSSLPDNAQFYMPKFASLLAPGYVPTAEDILHLRVPTTAVAEINFSFSSTKIRLVDVAGQRTYRKKWMHYFEGVSAVLFVASLAAYDQALEKVDISVKPVTYANLLSQAYDSKNMTLLNRLRDSADLFGEIIRNRFLASSAFILFLNKKDLLAKKLLTHPLKEYIRGYEGKSTEDACEFLRNYFVKRKPRRDKDRVIYTHYTCATDTKNVDFVFQATCDIILKKNLASSGIN